MSKRNSPGRRRRRERRAAAQPQNQNAGKPDGQTKTFCQVITTVSTGLLAILWVLAVTFNGFYGSFSENPYVQLMPFALTAIALVFFTAHRLVGNYSRFRYLLWGVALLLSVLIAVWAWERIGCRISATRRLTAERTQEHRAIIEHVDAGASNVVAKIDSSKEEFSALLLPESDGGDPHYMQLFLGPTILRSRRDARSLVLVQFDNQVMLELSLTPNGAAVSGQFRDRDQKIVATLETNLLTINRLNWFRKSLGKSSFSVTDQYGVEVLNVRRFNQSDFTLTGVMTLPNSKTLTITSSNILYGSDGFELSWLALDGVARAICITNTGGFGIGGR